MEDNKLIFLKFNNESIGNKKIILTVSFLAIRSAIVRFCDLRTSLTIGICKKGDLHFALDSDS